MLDKQGLKNLSLALYENKNFSENGVNGNDVMRKIIFDALHLPEDAKGIEIKRAYDKHKTEMFEVIDVAVDALLPTILKNEFDSLANFHNIQIGDVIRFNNRNKDLFRVARIAAGTKDIRRQTGLGSSYTIETDWYGAATYVEFEQFLTGQVDWNEFVQRIADSFSAFIANQIFTAISNSYDGLRTTLKATASFSMDQLLKLVRQVRVQSGTSDVTVYGTTGALSKVLAGLEMSSNMRDEFNRLGYLTTIQGVKFVAFPDALKPGTNELLVGDDTLLIIPSNEKIVDVVTEGATYTYEMTPEENHALQMDFKTTKRLGIGVRQAAVYGFYKLT